MYYDMRTRTKPFIDFGLLLRWSQYLVTDINIVKQGIEAFVKSRVSSEYY